MNHIIQYTFEIKRCVPTPAVAPAGLAWDGSRLWLNDYRAGRLLQIDSAAMEIVDSLICPGVLSGLAWDGQRLWQSRLDENWLQCINPVQHDFDETIPLAGYGRLSGIAWDGRQLWAAGLPGGSEQSTGTLIAINPDEGQATGRWPVTLANGALAYHDGCLWLGYAGPMVYDPASDTFTWSGAERQFGLRQFDLDSGREIGFLPLSFLPLGVCWTGSDLWLVDTKDNELIQGRLVSPYS